MAERTTVLIDADNYIFGVERSGHALRIEDLLRDLRQRFGRASRILVFMSAPTDRSRPRFRAAYLPRADIGRVERAASAAAADVVRADRNVDLTLAVYAMEELPRVEQVVLVSGDSGFVPLLRAARTAGIRTVVVSAPPATGAALAVAADELVDPGDLVVRIAGLIAPGGGAVTTARIITLIQAAGRRVVVIDPYISDETVRLMAWSSQEVELVLVGARLPRAAVDEAADIARAGRNLALYRSHDVHDRWFAVDDRWWHSGGSLKDLGLKWSRISQIDEPREKEQTENLLASLTIPANLVELV
jgi:uncharacterized LabA/DUF88 family protein